MKRISRKKTRHALEISAATVVLAVAYWYALPHFMRVQSINTQGNFPDPFFRNAVEEFMGVERGGSFTREEAAAKTGRLAVSGQGISDLAGIEFLTSITDLECKGTRITSLTIPENLALDSINVHSNQLLTSLDLSKCARLGHLNCYNNPLKTLDVTSNGALTALSCHSTQLTTLDVSKNPELSWLLCGDNPLETLDVTNNSALTTLNCSNTRLTSLDLSKNPKLKWLLCNGTALETLAFSNNPALEQLNCANCELTSLNVSTCPALSTLLCAENALTELNLTGNPRLHMLDCKRNRLSRIDLSANTQLAYLSLAGNPLSSFPDFSTFRQLTSLDLRDCDQVLNQHGALRALQKRLGEPKYNKEIGLMISGLAVTEP